MSAPSPPTGRRRGVARRRGIRQNPPRRKGAPLEDDYVELEPVRALPGRWFEIPTTAAPDPGRERWIDRLLRDPAGAKRELLEKRLQYWRARLEVLQKRLAEAEQDLHAALHPARADHALPLPPATLFQLRAERAVAWADVQHARAQVAALERELAQ